MQAPVLKHTTLTPFVGMALALGLAASIAVNVALLTRSDDDASPIAAQQASIALLAKQQRYYDAKVARIDAMEAAAGAKYVAPRVEEQSVESPRLRITDLTAKDQAFQSNQGLVGIDHFQAEPRAAVAAQAQSTFGYSGIGQIIVEQMLAAQHSAAAAQTQSQFSDMAFGQAIVAQMLAEQRAAVRQLAMDRADWLFYEQSTHLSASGVSGSESNSGQIGIDHFQADQRFAPTALDLYIVGAGE